MDEDDELGEMLTTVIEKVGERMDGQTIMAKVMLCGVVRTREWGW